MVFDFTKKIIAEVFGKKNEIEVKEMSELMISLLDLPEFFSSLLFNKIDKQHCGKITKAMFTNYWKTDLQLKD